jgi:hypothetical protein
VRLTKMLGLAAVAAVAAMAFIGAISASAAVLLESVLCKQKPLSEHHCPKGEAVTLPTTLKASLVPGTESELKAMVNDKCKTSTIEVLALKSEEHRIHGLIDAGAVTFSNCTCTTSKAVDLPWLSFLTESVNGNGTLLAQADGAGDPGLEVVCAGIKCVFKASDPTVTFDGGNSAGILVTVVLTRTEGSAFLCGNLATWEAVYEVTSPIALWVALFLDVL